ncbi:hypothetical protein [Mucilaginibacter sp. OK098]|uniref:hypothetical protein n=1 Tax=Mucilaginibacter sp. OK098 TaxID=1855297 RepID=UPI000917C986|nr:hypothetical protein [Mucilaginibacter sp. OK098]SHM94236.1 hypothetical protein SAMN05216524_104209 [Mucilaginibacter sp. OK098]
MKQKINLLICCFLLISGIASAQTVAGTTQAAESDANKTKTGATEDVLANYFQLAAKSITSTNSGVQVKLNWFALNMQSDRYASKNYLNSTWQRKGEFVGFGGVNSWQGGFNYNVLNRRDTTLANYSEAYVAYQPEEGKITQAAIHKFESAINVGLAESLTKLASDLFQAGQPVTDLKDKINTAKPGLLQGLPSDGGYVSDIQKALNDAINAHGANGPNLPAAVTDAIAYDVPFLTEEALSTLINFHGSSQPGNRPFTSFITDQQVTDLNKFLDDGVKNNKVLHNALGANTLADVHQAIEKKYRLLIQKVSRRPLLTFGYLYTGGTGKVLDSHTGGLTYIQSFGGTDIQKIGQLKASLTDTLTSSDPKGVVRNLDRNIIAFQAGYNQVLVYASKMSLAELNIALEEDRATSGYIANADKSKFYFDAYFRVRLPQTPWVKLNLKYDPKKNNLLGLLDFTYNLDK